MEEQVIERNKSINKGFLERLFQELGYQEWIGVIDWLLDDEKFMASREWDAVKLRKLTKRIKELDYIINGIYVYGKRKDVGPENYNSRRYRKKKSLIIMVEGQGESKDLIRHIRNGIAHGRAKLCTRNSARCVEIIDYGNHKNKNGAGGQTAYILIPVIMIKEIYLIYCSMC